LIDCYVFCSISAISWGEQIVFLNLVTYKIFRNTILVYKTI
jgi:hypothetical protein